MSNKINLIWKSEKDNEFIIGQVLSYQGRYYFSYNSEEVKKAILEGFNILDGFPRVNSKYFSEEPFKLFTVWASEHERIGKLNLEMLKQLTYRQFRFEEVIQDDENESLA